LYVFSSTKFFCEFLIFPFPSFMPSTEQQSYILQMSWNATEIVDENLVKGNVVLEKYLYVYEYGFLCSWALCCLVFYWNSYMIFRMSACLEQVLMLLQCMKWILNFKGCLI
jgi:hypothetical protein